MCESSAAGEPGPLSSLPLVPLLAGEVVGVTRGSISVDAAPPTSAASAHPLCTWMHDTTTTEEETMLGEAGDSSEDGCGPCARSAEPARGRAMVVLPRVESDSAAWTS